MHLHKWLFKILLVSAMLSACSSDAQQATTLSVDDFEKRIQQPNVQVLDVRTAGEYKTGHLKDAFLADWNDQQQFSERVQALDKSTPVYTYCLSGVRSAAATKRLRDAGYTAFTLDGGIAAWKRAAKPVEAAAEVEQMSLKEFQSLVPGDKTVLIDVGATWCPPCKKMNPVIDSLSKLAALQFQLVKIDGGEQTAIVKQLGVEGFPTFIIYKHGKEVWRKSGIVDAEELVKNIQ